MLWRKMNANDEENWCLPDCHEWKYHPFWLWHQPWLISNVSQIAGFGSHNQTQQMDLAPKNGVLNNKSLRFPKWAPGNYSWARDLSSEGLLKPFCIKLIASYRSPSGLCSGFFVGAWDVKRSYVVGWARAEGRVTKQCFCMFTALAPQRERIFSFFIVFRLSETSFFVFFCCFFWRGVGWGGGGWGGWGGVITFFGLEHIWDVMSWDLFLEFNTSGMVRHEIFSWNSTHLGWYVMRSFLGIQHIWDGTSWDLFLEFDTSWMVRHEIFSWN